MIEEESQAKFLAWEQRVRAEKAKATRVAAAKRRQRAQALANAQSAHKRHFRGCITGACGAECA